MITEKIEKLRTAIKERKCENINESIEELNNSWQPISQRLYANNKNA